MSPLLHPLWSSPGPTFLVLAFWYLWFPSDCRALVLLVLVPCRSPFAHRGSLVQRPVLWTAVDRWPEVGMNCGTQPAVTWLG